MSNLKGIILAGGNGRRLSPLTDITNKHLLPVYNKQVILFPLNTLLQAGIKDILIIIGPEHAGSFFKILGSGRKFNCNLHYEVQEEAGGIAQALSLADNFAKNSKIAAILGDNIFSDNFKVPIEQFANKPQNAGANIFLKTVSDPERFGVAELSETNQIISIEEKPQSPKSNLAITGLYLYDETVFSKIQKLKPSKRGELEITDLNNLYLQENNLKSNIIQGDWSDIGTFESLHRANVIARSLSQK